MKAENQPLVSIVVITYNSGKYVLETLNSVYAQEYPAIELIITDDASSDNTFELCREWLSSHQDRFVRAELLRAKQNTGIAGNCNRGLVHASGAWIKMIAGDDSLEPGIIQAYIDFLSGNPDVKCVYSNVNEYDHVFDEAHLLPQRNLRDLRINQADCTAGEQFSILLRDNPVWASTIMINRDILTGIGAFNEAYAFFEDRPMLLALTKAGYRICYLDITGAKYRRHRESVQVAKRAVFMSRLKQDQENFFLNECLSHYESYEQWVMKYRHWKNKLLRNAFNNKSNVLVKVMSRLLELVPRLYLTLNRKGR